MASQFRGVRVRVSEFMLMLASISVVLVAAEAGYRIFLDTNTVLSYNVANRALYKFDDHTGFVYAPDISAVIANIRRGVPSVYGKIETGPYGNLGNGVKSWTNLDLKIMVFGDSFTAYPYNNHSWADQLGPILQKEVRQPVQVMNLARDGFGVLQIFAAAAHSAATLGADEIIIALIADDMDRARTWRTSVLVDGTERILMSTIASDAPAADISQDVVLVHEDVSLEWCKQVEAWGGVGDALVEELNTQYKRLLPENYKASLWSWRVSFLYNRLVAGDPFYGLRNVEHIPRVEFRDFREDPEFMSHLAMLKKSGIPFRVVLLPSYQDFVNGEYVFTEHQRELFTSLESLLEKPVVFVLERIKQRVEKPEECYLLPLDHHPSDRGATLFASAIAEVLADSAAHPGERPLAAVASGSVRSNTVLAE